MDVPMRYVEPCVSIHVYAACFFFGQCQHTDYSNAQGVRPFPGVAFIKALGLNASAPLAGIPQSPGAGSVLTHFPPVLL